MTTFAFAVTAVASLRPADNSGNPVDRHHGSVGNAAGRVEHAEHHGHAALPGERSEMRSAAAELRHHCRDVRQDFGKRRAGDRGDEHLSWANALEFALAIDHACPAFAPADTGRMS